MIHTTWRGKVGLSVLVTCGFSFHTTVVHAQGMFLKKDQSGLGFAVSFERAYDFGSAAALSVGLSLGGILDPSVSLGQVWLSGKSDLAEGADASGYGFGVDLHVLKELWPKAPQPVLSVGFVDERFHVTGRPSPPGLTARTTSFGGYVYYVPSVRWVVNLVPSLGMTRALTDSPGGAKEIGSTLYWGAVALTLNQPKSQTFFVQPTITADGDRVIVALSAGIIAIFAQRHRHEGE